MAGTVVSLWKAQTDEAAGRDAELASLCRSYEEARAAGAARFVLVRGPAGVGKSHLFSLFRQHLLSRGVPVFETESGRDSRRPFGLFAALAESIINELGHSAVPPDVLVSLSRRVAPLLGRMPSEALEGDRLDAYDAACELLALAGRTQPVFLLPDLDAADRASLELFRYLADVVSSPESAAAGLFVASFRDDCDLPAPLNDALQRLGGRTLALGGFDVDGIRAYLTQPGVAERLFEATGGIPARLEALFLAPQAGAYELLHRRTSRLGEPAQMLLSFLALAPAAALGADLLRDAMARAGAPLSLVPAELDALVRERLLSVKVGGGVPLYRFAQDAERTLYAQRLEPEARAFHQRALGQVLRERGERLGAAELLLEADPTGEGAAAVRDAAQSLLAGGAYEEVERLLGRLLPSLPRAERDWAHGLLAVSAWAQRRYRAVLFHLVRARPAGRRQPPSPAMTERAARALFKLGRLRLANALLTPLTSAEDGALVAGAVVLRAEILLSQGRGEDVERLAAEWLPRLHEGKWVEHALGLRQAFGQALLARGEWSQASRLFEESQEMALRAGLRARAAQALLHLGEIAHRRREFERAIRLYEAALPEADRLTEGRALAGLGAVYTDTADFDRAIDAWTRALRIFRRHEDFAETSKAATQLAKVYLFLADFPRAEALAQHAIARAAALGIPGLEGGAQLVLGNLLLERDDVVEARDLLEQARLKLERAQMRGEAALAAALKARAHLRLGERAQAQETLSHSSLEAAAASLPQAALELALVRTEAAIQANDVHEATRSLGRARDSLLEKADFEGPARVHALLARVKAAAQDFAGAQTESARAARLVEELTQRLPAGRRALFLSLPRRAEVHAAAQPEQRMPRVPLTIAPVRERPSAYGLIGQSPAMQRVGKQMEPVARSNTTVLIRGESGTGKELLAQAIHDFSPRKTMPLVKVNCAAMVEDLLLSELFGHEKGAFTGAVRERKGRFELADGGTLFLDEIGDISPKCQVALLRALQEREFQRVGGTKTLKVDVRVICATNRDLETLIAQGQFRRDLYYRLKGVMLELPALRERLEDLPELAAHFLERIAKERDEAPKSLSPEALALLSRHEWPGNVRELENVLASAVIFAEGPTITTEAFVHVAELSALMSGAQPSALPPLRSSQGPALTSMAASRMPFESTVAHPPAPAQASAPEEPASDAEDDDEEILSPSSGFATPSELDFYSLARTSGLSLKELRHQIEMQCIQRALIEGKGNISEAARLLGMKRSRLSQIVNADASLRALHQDD